MLHNYRIALTAAEFGEMLAANIQKSYEVENCKTVNVHAMTEDGREMEVFNTDDTYGLILTISDIACNFTGKLNNKNPEIDEFGLDIFETLDGTIPFLQLDIKVDLEKRKIKITDLRLPNDNFWNGFGVGYAARVFICQHMTKTGIFEEK